ncbi:MAG: hypothetical protein PUG64_03555 [Bacteroidales bacterium]|nr:hypothetical protein [Bacteroidales bacterium]MDY3912909.1 hypothetical protein [Sodaliphilus sp.]
MAKIELAHFFALPRCRLIYEKLVQTERNGKSLSPIAMALG